MRIRTPVILFFCLQIVLVGCDSDGYKEGDSRFFAVRVDGGNRTFEAYVPAAVGTEEPVTLLLAFHGSPGNSAGMRQSTGLNTVADAMGLVVVYPNSTGSWAPGCACTDADFAGVNDLGYVEKMLERLETEFNVDKARVFALGFSQGGVFAYRLGCSFGHRFAGVLALGSSMSWHQAETCEPEGPVPVFVMLGTEDPAFPWEGTGRSGGQSMPIDSTLGFWARINHCGFPADVSRERRVDNGLDVRTQTYPDCEREVILHAVVGMEHLWPATANERIGAFLARN